MTETPPQSSRESHDAATTACWYCGASERFPWTRWLLGRRLRPALTFFGFGPVPMCPRCIEFKIGSTDDWLEREMEAASRVPQSGRAT